jgi:acetyltransferase
LDTDQSSLEYFFAPKTVAVIGATETPLSVGRTVIWNLISNQFGGTVFPVNPHRQSVLGVTAYKSVATVPAPVDLAVVVTPAATVPGVIRECVDAGVKGAIIISAGFKEFGVSGVELEQQVLTEARRGSIRIIGPNCLGVMSPISGLNATFARGVARPGNVGFISQSGALCTAILDWSLQESVGFSAFVSIGSMLDVGYGDLIDYLGDDRHTKSIVIYMESIGDPRSFLSAAREVALTKPIIIIKAGRTEAASQAAASHTGAMTGSDEVLDAAFRRCGVLRVTSISDLFYMAEVLSKQPRPRGPRLAILTNAGGPGVLATDALISEGGELAELSDETIEQLNRILPPHWSRHNPVDILGDADADRYAKATDIVSKDPNNDGVLVVLAPQAIADPTLTADKLKVYAHLNNKPFLASWMGGADVKAGEEIFNRTGIPAFSYPDTAARAFNYMWRYSYNLRGLYETPIASDNAAEKEPDRIKVAAILNTARQSNRTVLTEVESKEIVAAYGIPVVPTRLADDEATAVKQANAIGYPVVLKIYSQTITHKTDVGGVQLNLTDENSVRNAFQTIKRSVSEKAGAEHFQGVTVQKMVRTDGYELIIGSSLDPQFGPILLFGSGGQLVEVYKDKALALPPLNTTLARRMMEQTRICTALTGVRGRKAVDVASLERLLVAFSNLVVENPRIKEIDINPLLVSADDMIALDARVILHGNEIPDSDLPATAVRPYPVKYISSAKLKNGEGVTVRPIRAEDETAMIAFHKTLSELSVYYRYFSPLKLNQRLDHERLSRICFIDYDRQIALAVERKDSDGKSEIIGVGRLIKMRNGREGEFAILISDGYQRQGLGTILLSMLLQIGRDEKLDRVFGTIMNDNKGMQKICQNLGFALHYSIRENTVKAVIDL